MVVGVMSSIVSAILIGGASLVWRHRDNLSLLRTTLYPRGLVRVSFAALLRIKDDDRYVLVRSSLRPGFYGPPGGVFKYRASATDELDALGFREQRFESHRDHMRADLRGFVPAGSAARFLRWFVTGEDRETAAECLRRGLDAALAATDGARVVGDLHALTFKLVRVIVEGPRRVPRQSRRLMRRFEVYDLAITDERSAELRRRLIDLGDDNSIGTVVCAKGTDITTGWSGRSPVAPHSAYLLGPRKFLPDLPPMPLAAPLAMG